MLRLLRDERVEVNLDSIQSVYRERLLEHLLVGELLKHSWLKHGASLEVSQPAVDRSGYDIVLEAHGITRHVQLKASSGTAKTAVQKIHVGLAAKPSGCVVWIQFAADTLQLGPFRFFGGDPGSPLPPLDGFQVAKHTKANSKGEKLERPNIRVVPRARFIQLNDIGSLYAALFGRHDGILQVT